MTPFALAYLIHTCAPTVHPQTLAAIVQVESGGWPWAIHDNTAGRSDDPPTYGHAVAIANALIAQGHNVDLGLAQVNSGNLAALGLTPAQALAPCANLAAGARILEGDYSRARAHFGTAFTQRYPRTVLLYAVSAYNTGSLFAGARYVRKVVDAALLPTTAQVARLAERLGSPQAVAAPRPITVVHFAPTLYEHRRSEPIR